MRTYRNTVGALVFAVGITLSTTSAIKAQDAQATINTLVQHETDASSHRGYYIYLSQEKSDRTGGHLWTEKVAETHWGKVHYLLAEDGKPLSPDRAAAEKSRVSAEAADPEAFKKAESARIDDEMHAKQMLALLPKAFLFDGPTQAGDFEKLAFRPNPDYSPQSMEERVLHGMSGFVLIEPKDLRLREINGKIPQDISIGFGFLATIKAGSNFTSVRQHVEGIDWKTVSLHTEINGKALFLKTIARQQESKHTDFKKLPQDISLPEAVAMLEQ